MNKLEQAIGILARIHQGLVNLGPAIRIQPVVQDLVNALDCLSEHAQTEKDPICEKVAPPVNHSKRVDFWVEVVHGTEHCADKIEFANHALIEFDKHFPEYKGTK